MRIKALGVFLFLLAAAVVQTTVGPRFALLGVAPDLVLVLVVCRALLSGSREGMLWGMLGGIAVGLLSGAPLGTHALMLAIVGFIVGLAEASPFVSRLVVPSLAIIAATLLYNAGMGILLRLTGWPLMVSPAITRVIVLVVASNGLLMLVCYWAMSLFVRRGGMQSEL